jgi:dephospho-CoA kinase
MRRGVPMRVYAVVGGIGAGKTTVSRLLARRHGGAVLDADRAGHQILRAPRVRRRLLALFGADIVGKDGEVDRAKLGACVFGHPKRLRALNALVHPEIARQLRARLAALERRGVPFVLLDAALYYEFGAGIEADGVLAVTASRRARLERLRRRDRLPDAALRARLASQPRLPSWIRRADVRLDTECPRIELGERAERAWRELRRSRRHARNPRGG